ncbi:TonB-dependent receptor [Siccibacter colletis]|uniref:TonB-dependent receptor n=1 Tax=Siccibacter colletis TaxID=1505757 RepID=UPI003CF82A82
MISLPLDRPGARPRLLALAVSLAIAPAWAAETKPDDTITVTASPDAAFRAGGDELVPAYLDGQVANGGRLGGLGEQDANNVPFNVIGYTAKMIEDTQATTLSDVLRYDAGVQPVRSYGNFGESYRIRGFLLDGDDISFGGLYGVLPRQIVSSQLAERVEVIKGSNAFLNGVTPGGSGVGGAINIEPKRAGSVPLNRVTVDYAQRGQVGGAIDSGRRFGENDRFGVRVNLLHREGESMVHEQKERISLASIGLDYKGDSFRSSLDAGWQKITSSYGRISVGLGQATQAPEVPENRTNYSQPWVNTNMSSRFAALRGEYDFAPDWTWYAGLGGANTDERGISGSATLLNNEGDSQIRRMDSHYIADSVSGMTGVRGKFETGFVDHSINLGYSGVYRKAGSSYTMSAFVPGSNIYNPSVLAYPSEDAFSGGNMGDPHYTSRTRSTGTSLSDTLSMFDDRLLITAGLRRQKVEIHNYDYQGVEKPADTFSATKVTPVYGVVVKPWDNVSLYANHIEALQPGPTASSKATNAGQVMGAIRTKQNEVGVKLDYGRIGGSLALFEIEKPVGMMDSNNYYGIYGEQRNRGMELSVFGEPVYGVRLMGSAQWLAPELTKTQGGANDGNDAPGVPRYQLRLGGEWDVPALENLTLNAAVLRNGSQYANASNSVKLDAWTRLDLGARYSMKVNEQTLIWRATVENVTDEKYWASVDDSGTYLTQGDPRTLKLSMSVDF